ncbi:MAG: efflux RND transporter permease subunit [Pseudomonadota bacterium]
MIAWFARNDIAANLLMVAIIISGAYALAYETSVEIFPTIEPDRISVTVALRGASPEDAELGLAVHVEQAIDGIPGIKSYRSVSREGSTAININVDEDADPETVLNAVKSRVDAINTFPAEAERPITRLAQRQYPVITVAVGGSVNEAELRQFAERVRDDLLANPAISQVDLESIGNYEIAIEASQDRLRQFNLSLAELTRTIRASSIDLSAGNVRTLGGDILIRSKGQAYQRAEFENLVVKTNPDGSITRLGDVATILDGFQEDTVKTMLDGMSAALVEVDRTGSESALEISAEVKAYVEQMQNRLPTGLELAYWDDNAQQLRNRLGVLGNSAWQGALLVILLLALFLRPKIALWVFIGIPISFIGAFTVMSAFGVSLNLMSAFGFIVVLGIIVDDAIVTGESVYQRLKKGESGLDASVNGTIDVAVPVTFGVLTTMVAFLPLAFIEGSFGNIMAPVAAVVVSVLLFSLIESKLVLPAHLKGMGKRLESAPPSRMQAWQASFADGFEAMILRHYRPTLQLLLQHRYSTFAVFVGVLFIVVALVNSGWTRFTFMPSVQGETAVATLTMPVGTPYELTDQYVNEIFASARQMQLKYTDQDSGQSIIKHIVSSTGARGGTIGSHLGRVRFELQPPEERRLKITTSELLNEWRQGIGPIPGAEALTFRASFFRVGDPISIQLTGDSLAQLEQAATQIKQHLTTYPTVSEVADTLSNGKDEIRIEVKPQGYALGLTRSDIVTQVSQAFRGFEVQRIQRGRDDVRVLVRLPAAERADMSTLEGLLISTPAAQQVPLAHVATLTPGKGPLSITRINRFRTISISAEVDKANTNMTALQNSLRSYLDELVPQYPGLRASLEGEAREQRESFSSVQSGLLIVVFVIYAMLALPLRSYSLPLVVMSVIPFGVIGAVAGHWIMGYTLSMLSVMGLLALTGVVVNDSLVLVDAVSKQRKGGVSLHEAVLNAGVIRFRPILLTSLTTFFGLMPMLLEKSTTAQFLIPMGISLSFGMLFATVITLVLVPVNLLIARDIRHWSGNASASIVSLWRSQRTS